MLGITESGPDAGLYKPQRILETLLDNLPGLVYRCRHDEDWTLEFASEGCLELTGYSGSDFVSQAISFQALVHPDDLDALTSEVEAAIREQRRFQHIYRLISAAGETKWVWEQGQPIYAADGELAALEGFITDITKYKKAELALRESEQRFRRMADGSPALIWQSDTSKRCTWFNAGWLSFTGRSMDQELGDGWAEGVHPDDLQYCLDTYRSAFDARKNFTLEYRLRRHDGSYGWIFDAGIPRFMADGTFEGYIGYCWDVSDRIESNLALALSEQRFHSLFNSTFQFIGLLDPDGILLEANQTALDMAGLENEDVIGRPFWETPWWAHSPVAQQRLKDSIRQAARGELVRYETEHYTPDGKQIIVDFSLKPVINEHGETVNIIPEGRDITELKNLQLEEKRHARAREKVMRLNTIGEMATGMAHELNQPLTAIASYCESALQLFEQLPSPPRDLDEILKRAREQAYRAGEIIHNLRRVVSRGETRMEPVVFDDMALRVIDLMKWDMRDAQVSIGLDLNVQGREVMLDQVQIEQVLINLVRNAMEAIEEAEIIDGWVELKTAISSNDSIEVTVTDNGPGIAADMLDKLFSPFKSSKASGMGIGLSICRSIIETHRGTLWVDKEYEKGARFGFNLPLSG